MRALLIAILTLVVLTGCTPRVSVVPKEDLGGAVAGDLDVQTIATTARMATASPPATKATGVVNPILFVTQVPTRGDEFASRGSTFANHRSHIGGVPRGGDLMIRYPDGSLRNLTQEAGFGMSGQQGTNAIAVREPTVHWDGQKALFSMLTGAPPRYQHASNPWQIYEVSGLGQGQTVQITKVAGQPTAYNNISPLYTSDDQILFTSDRPRDGRAHLHPQLDEYESTPTIVGIYKLDRATGQLDLLNHTPSGAFSPTIDSAGRVIFIRWDHLQRDQQADAGTYGANNFANEDAGTAAGAVQPEVFPEARLGMSSPYGAVNGLTYNLFTPWEMNQDGTHELSLNHIGRHELTFGYMPKSFANDSHLQDNTGSAPRANSFYVRMDGGLFHMREDPTEPGTFYTVYAREFYELSAGRQILRMRSPVGLNAEAISLVPVTPSESGEPGRYRDVQPLASGHLVASYLPQATVPTTRGGSVRLVNLVRGANGQFTRTETLTPGITKTVTWWDPDNAQTYSGELWELEPAEVVARTRPPLRTVPTEQGERTIFQQEGVDEVAFRAWMKERNLALVVVRNQTHRDRGDRQQPFNLRVPGGVSTTATSGPLYDISHFQVLQANLVRGYNGQAGRRPLPQPTALNDALHPTRLGPVSSVGISADGSSAAFVPARRALTWQTTDANGEPIVRERLWVTMQPGEIRTCSGCHGENVAHQAGGAASTAPTQAMRDLLRHWKAQNGPRRVNGSQPLVPGGR